MGCNCSCDSSENEFEISNPNNLIVKNIPKEIKRNKDVYIRPVINDYKILKENSKKIQKIYLKSKKSEKYPLLKFQKEVDYKTQNNAGIHKIKIIKYSPNTKNKEIIKKIKSKKIKIKIKKKKIEFNPLNIQYLKDITQDSYSYFYLDNTFTVFNSVNNILYLIYSTRNRAIISYNLIENKKINEIKNAHKELIINFRHYLDKPNKTDLVISLSYDNNIKLWNINLWECISNLNEINKNGYSLTACFLNDNNKYYILTSNYSDNSELIKIYDINGEKVKEISGSGDDASFIDAYYDEKLNKNYIITGNIGYCKSYDYNENNLYHIYGDNDLEDHCCVIINKNKEIIKMIESSGDGSIRIWNFHSADLLDHIIVSKKRLFGMILWNDEYLFVGCEDKSIKLLELESGDIINNLIGKNKAVLTIKKLFHPKYGKCLISQGIKDNQIKLWIYKK